MCGRLVNLDTVARVLAEYYHIKTDTQLAALNEALSRVPTETVGDSHKKDHVADPRNMVGDSISRQADLDVIEAGRLTKLIDAETAVNGLKALPSAQPTDEEIQRMQDIEQAMLEKAYWFGKQDAQQWIPTSERLPKVREWVLCQCRAGIMDVLRLTEDGSWNKNYPHAEYMSGFVIAWMPLPEPWKGEQNE